MISKKCTLCQNEYFSKPSAKRIYCSSNCWAKTRTGNRNSNWKNGKSRNGGYIEIYTPNHPFRNKSKRVLEHRLVMEKHVGRYLKPNEEVHHLNRVKTDNRLENLVLFTTHSEHIADHHNIKNRTSNGRFSKAT